MVPLFNLHEILVDLAVVGTELMQLVGQDVGRTILLLQQAYGGVLIVGAVHLELLLHGGRVAGIVAVLTGPHLNILAELLDTVVRVALRRLLLLLHGV